MMNIPLMVSSHLSSYLVANGLDWDDYKVLSHQILNHEDLQDRKNMNGHVTSSFMLLSPCKTKILMIHHKGLEKWLCPGGHYEGDVPPQVSAIRELEEETGFPAGKVVWFSPNSHVALDVDSHLIPSRPHKGEGEHYHHDFLYLGIATEECEPNPQVEEVYAAEWKLISDAEKLPNVRLQRCIVKLKTILENMNKD